MRHKDHVRLIKDGVVPGVWADLGSGEGAFTLALADAGGPGTVMYTVDKNLAGLASQKDAFQTKFPDRDVTYIHSDFTKALTLPPLDGVIMANSLHFIKQKAPFLRLLRTYLKPGGRLLLVEYNVDKGNIWVPYPLSFPTWQTLAGEFGFGMPELLATQPSQFLSEIYSSLAILRDIE